MTAGSGEYQALIQFVRGADHSRIQAFPWGPKLDTSAALLLQKQKKKDALLRPDFFST